VVTPRYLVEQADRGIEEVNIIRQRRREADRSRGKPAGLCVKKRFVLCSQPSDFHRSEDRDR
jgi:hypothetical protein